MSFTYDNRGLLTSVKSPANTTTQYQYDHRGLMTKLTDAMGNSELLTYNVAGLLTKRVDRNGTQHNFTYDSLGRETSYTAGAEYRYTTYSQLGQVLSVANAVSTLTYTYNSLGQMTKQTETSVADGKVTKDYTYNIAGMRTGMTVTKGSASNSTSYAYDQLGRLTTVSSGSDTATYAYDVNGNLSSLTRGSTVTSYTYNLANLVVGMTNTINNATHSYYSYTYLLDGNQSKIEESVNDRTTLYEYDGAGRLTQEAYSKGIFNQGAVSYTYDSAGNRHTMTDTRNEGDDPAANMTQKGFMYNLNNCLTYTCQTYADGKIKLDWFTYDANGNQTSRTSELWSKDKMVSIDPQPTKDLRGGDSEPTPTPDPNVRTETPTPEPGRGDPTPEPTETPDPDAPVLLSTQSESYTYNEIGLLVGINADYYDAEYTYNPDGLRHSKTVNSETRVHIWDGMSIAGESVDNGNPTWYVRGHNLLWSKNAQGTTSYLYNAHGDVVKTTGAVENDYLYDAFGNQVDESTNQPFNWRVEVAPTVTDGNPFRYCGEYFDYETGYIYLRARYYDSSNGRFISEDPIRSGNNWYAYCGGNPIRFSDPTGLRDDDDDKGKWAKGTPQPQPPPSSGGGTGGSGGGNSGGGSAAAPNPGTTNPYLLPFPSAFTPKFVEVLLRVSDMIAKKIPMNDKLKTALKDEGFDPAMAWQAVIASMILACFTIGKIITTLTIINAAAAMIGEKYYKVDANGKIVTKTVIVNGKETEVKVHNVDCSKLVRDAFKCANITLSGNAEDIVMDKIYNDVRALLSAWKDLVTDSKTANEAFRQLLIPGLMTGDLIFWRNDQCEKPGDRTYEIHHVGIFFFYIGGYTYIIDSIPNGDANEGVRLRKIWGTTTYYPIGYVRP